MGFFSELKEDLSQAVNELMPEDAIKEEVLPENSEELVAEDMKSNEESVDVTNMDDLAKLDEMLERVDSIEVPMEEETTESGEEEVEPEIDLETSIREAFGEKTEKKGTILLLRLLNTTPCFTLVKHWNGRVLK